MITPQSLWSDDPGADLVKVAMEANVEWIVLGPHLAVFGTDYGGGVVQGVLDRARALPINVAVAIQAGEAHVQRIFAAADPSHDGRAAIDFAARVAAHRQLNLHVVRVNGESATLELEFLRELALASDSLGRQFHMETIPNLSPAILAERAVSGLLVIAAGVAERLGLARRGFAGFPDGRPMVLVQGAKIARSSIKPSNGERRTMPM